MSPPPIFLAIIATTSLTALSMIYIVLERKRQKVRQRNRQVNIQASDRHQALSSDAKQHFEEYVMGTLNKEERKRIVCQTFGNLLLTAAGALPILSTVVHSPAAVQMMSIGASLALLILKVFSLERHSFAHDRAAYLINAEIGSWLSASGPYLGLTPEQAYSTLSTAARVVLDNDQTSFVGSPNSTGAGDPTRLPDSLSVAPAVVPPGTLPVEWSASKDGTIAHDFEIIPDTSWAQWQADSLADADCAEITQYG
jgi:hypothetical protein